MFDVRKTDLNKVNSMTKYPSILTYHAMGDKGVLTDTIQVPFSGTVVGSEKVDGSNTRIIACPDGSVIVGSREELLWEKDDLISNPSMGIVDAVKEIVLNKNWESPEGRFMVWFLETFGKNIGSNAKNYTKQNKVGLRLFDIATIEEHVLNMSVETIARWREDGGQEYFHSEYLPEMGENIGVEVVPSLFEMEARLLPITIEKTHEFLLEYDCRAKLDESGLGVPEGIVVRSFDRKFIAKMRREDYGRTMRKRK